MSKTLVNFLVEQADLDRFDSVVSMLGRTRTSVLTEMMRMFCTEQVVAVEQRNRNPDVSYRDSLAQEHGSDAGKYSLILANPPFAGSLDYDATAKDLQQIVKTKKTELLFMALFLSGDDGSWVLVCLIRFSRSPSTSSGS